MTDTTNQSLNDQAEALLALLRATEAGAEPFDINHFVHRLLGHVHKIAPTWCIEDVQTFRPDLTDDQAWEVLEEAGRKHDAEYGISWLTLEWFAYDMFPNPPQTDPPRPAASPTS